MIRVTQLSHHETFSIGYSNSQVYPICNPRESSQNSYHLFISLSQGNGSMMTLDRLTLDLPNLDLLCGVACIPL